MFDLGAEIFILPSLWAVLLTTVIGMTISALKRETILDEEGDYDYRKWNVDTRRLKRAGALFGIGAIILASIVIVPPGHRGAIYTTSGVDIVERGEGYSLMVPILHNANMVNVREQVYENEEVFAQTADLLEVTMQIGVNYLINPDQAADIFRNVGLDYEAALIKPAVLDISKEHVGRVDALDFPREREKISQSILSGLRDRLAPLGITVTFVAIEDAIFATEFVQAVLAKEIAEEKATESERLVQVATNEAEQVRQRAQGDADAITTLALARQDEQTRLGLTSTEYVWYSKWDGILPTTLLGAGGEFIVNLP